MTEFDVVILSFAKTDAHRQVTQNCIDSIINTTTSPELKTNIVVVESNHSLAPFSFPGSLKTIYPKTKFGYHKYMNIGISELGGPFVCMCNNDLIFHEGWAEEILSAFEKDEGLASVSPRCPDFHKNIATGSNQKLFYGYEIQQQVAGWCIVARRTLLNRIGPLDEKFVFWYCDNDYARTLQKNNLKHALVLEAKVTHLHSFTSSREKPERWFYLTRFQEHYFNYKWGHRNKLRYRFDQFRALLAYIHKRLFKSRYWENVFRRRTD